MSDSKAKTAASYGDSNLRRSTATSRGRSKSPGRGTGPWVPPPGKTSKGLKYSWQVSVVFQLNVWKIPVPIIACLKLTGMLTEHGGSP